MCDFSSYYIYISISGKIYFNFIFIPVLIHRPLRILFRIFGETLINLL